MRDSELAASIVDGDPGALAEAYDKYADLLWSYCHSLLNDADRAAEAVADTFVIAASRLDVLPALGRLRAWLYAVARNECQRMLRSAKDAAAPGGAERLRHTAMVLSTGEQRQLRALLTEAFVGLDPDERDVMQMVWHGLDLAEVAAILGRTRADAYALFTKARDQLEASVGVLLMGWSGRGGCDEFEDMLYGRDSKLTPELRAKLGRHIVKCGTCAESYRRQMRPSLVLCLSVGALLAEAADARAAASQAPASLWEQVYQMTSQRNPESRWNKILGGRRVSFGPDGFPKQIAAAREGLSRTPLKVAAVGTVAVAATATGWATHAHFTAQPDATANSASHGISAVAPSATPAASKGAHAGKPSTKTTSRHKPAHAKPGGAQAGQASPGTAPSSLPVSASSAVPVSGGSTSSATSGSASSGSSASGSSSGSSSSGSATTGSSSGSSAPAAGTLSVSTHNIALNVGSSATFTLTANGGPVNWSISVPSGLLGSVTVSQQSGSLAAGHSVTITVTGTGVASVGSQLVISPGNQTVTVDVSLL